MRDISYIRCVRRVRYVRYMRYIPIIVLTLHTMHDLFQQLPDLKSVLPAVLFSDPKESKEAREEGGGEEVEALLARLPHASTREQVDALATTLVEKGARFQVKIAVR